jgi:hypothetical protein
MKRTTQSPPSSPKGQWSPKQTPVKRTITEEAPVHEPLPEQTHALEEPKQPTISVWDSMPETAWITVLTLTLEHAEPLVWGDHQGEDITSTAAVALPACDDQTTPLLFKKLGDLTNIASRIESVLLMATSDPARFARTLDSLVGAASKLIGHPHVNGGQAYRLRRLLMTAMAIAHQHGLTRDARLLKTLAALAIEQKKVLSADDYWLLLSDLETALQTHADENGQVLATIHQTREALEAHAVVADFIPRDPRKMIGASLPEKQACLKALVNQPPPCGPLFIAQWCWVTSHWDEPELRPYILDGVAQLLTEAVKGMHDKGTFPGAFLFDLFPQDALNGAFDYVGGPDNSRLLQVKPLTERARALLNHYLADENVPETQRQRLREWHEMA